MPLEAKTASLSPKLVDVELLATALRSFAAERDWEQFHSPKNLVMALTAEVGELSELFQWMSEQASQTAGSDSETTQAVHEELADVLLYLVRLSDVLGVDLNAAAIAKLSKNAEKYPAEQARGTSKKYDKL